MTFHADWIKRVDIDIVYYWLLRKQQFAYLISIGNYMYRSHTSIYELNLIGIKTNTGEFCNGP